MKKIILFAITILVVSSCASTKKAEIEAQEQKQIEKYLTDHNLTANPTKSGLYFIETKKGEGKQVQSGSVVTVHYTGKFLDGKVFDSSYSRQEPLQFTVGAGQVIKGWDEGLKYMKEGGRAILIIPSKLAYGKKGAGEIIPPNTPLVFEVELLKVE